MYALVVAAEARRKKNNNGYVWHCDLQTPNGLIKSVMWDAQENTDKDLSFPQVKDLILINDYKDEIAEYGNIKINQGGFIRVKLEEVPLEQREAFNPPKMSKESIDWAKKIISDPNLWTNPDYGILANKIFKNKNIMEKFLKYPAAQSVHHNKLSGLFVHSAEVLNISRGIALSLPSKIINKDVLYFSAIFHDLGKIYTYKLNDFGMAEIDTAEDALGHVYFSTHIIHNVMEETDVNISNRCLLEILHCIASHHGSVEKGSIKPCYSIESLILNKADEISAKNNMLEAFVPNGKDTFRLFGDRYLLTSGLKGE